MGDPVTAVEEVPPGKARKAAAKKPAASKAATSKAAVGKKTAPKRSMTAAPVAAPRQPTPRKAAAKKASPARTPVPRAVDPQTQAATIDLLAAQAQPEVVPVGATSVPVPAVGAEQPRRGLFDLRGRFADMTDLEGASRTALFTLFGLNLVDELDRIAFSTLTPEIRDAFDLTDQQIVAVGSISGMFVLLAAIPIGYMADRYSRLRMAKVAALMWGVMTVLTGTAWAVPVLFLARFFSGVAKSSNEIVHTGLLVDYYEPRLLPRVFQFHRIANSLATVTSLVAGGIAVALGWRWAFVLLALPTFALVVKLQALHEPDRGAMIDAAAARAAGSTRPSYWASTKELLRIRSMRRIWIGFFVFGIGLLAFAQMLSLFFEDVYGFGPFGRGMVSFMFGLGSIIGILVGGQIGTRYTKAGDFATLTKIVAAGFAVFALGILGLFWRRGPCSPLPSRRSPRPAWAW